MNINLVSEAELFVRLNTKTSCELLDGNEDKITSCFKAFAANGAEVTVKIRKDVKRNPEQMQTHFEWLAKCFGEVEDLVEGTLSADCDNDDISLHAHNRRQTS
jgi:hypothetical protein